MVNLPVEGWPETPGPKHTPSTGRASTPAISDAQLAAWYGEHFAFVWRTLRRFGVSDAEVEDAVQEVFIVAHRRRDDFEGRATPRTWLYGIARRVASDWRRGRDRRVRRESAFAQSRADLRPSQQHAAKSSPDAWLFLEQFLDGLDPDLREAFVLFELEGLRAAEASALTGANANTLYARRRRAKRAFADAMASAKVDHAALRTAARAQRPPKEAQRRLAGALPFMPLPAGAPLLEAATQSGGVATGTGLASGGASVSATSGAGTWLAIKTALIAAVATGAVVLGGAAVVRSQADDDAVVTANPAPTAAATQAAAATEPTTTKPGGVEDEEAAPTIGDTPGRAAVVTASPAGLTKPSSQHGSATAGSSTAAPPSTDPLADEVARQKAARAALATGNAREALSLANDYLAEYPNGRFVVPTRVLRVESLCVLAQSAAAREVAMQKARDQRDRLLQLHPELAGRPEIKKLCAAN